MLRWLWSTWDEHVHAELPHYVVRKRGFRILGIKIEWLYVIN